jgi:tetratricopeptide (TPR) repeat protein
MAYAEKRINIPTASYSAGSAGRKEVVPWDGYLVPDYRQFDVRSSDDPKITAAARDHLTKAIARFREALELQPAQPIAMMGLGWTLSQSGDRAGAIATLRELVKLSEANDRTGRSGVMMGNRSLTEEAILYLVPLLEPERDRDEIDRLRATADFLSRQMRPITPIAVPLRNGTDALEIVDDTASVAFDLDGSALPQRWTWIRPTAAWLVFDKHHTGSITSGLQLFGSVTFWLFWQNGYDALRALDDDGDRRIAGAELTGLALWHDRDADGVSDRGEVQPVSEWGIVSLSCDYEFDATHPDEIAISPRGVTFRDGSTRPTFDLILQPAVK